MKIVIAIDSFKGSMSSMEAGYAAKKGIERAYGFKSMEEGNLPGPLQCSVKKYVDEKTAQTLPEIVVKPLADGGEGTTEALVEGLGGTIHEVSVTGPMGEKTVARYGILQDGRTAVMEMAEAAGITLVDPRALNPWRASTVGVGQMIPWIRDAGNSSWESAEVLPPKVVSVC